ncbi:werner syndrome-like exonuclease, partial [Phtheirospermum japonicum]
QHLRRRLLRRLHPHHRHPRPRRRHSVDLRRRVGPPPRPHRRPRHRVAPVLQPSHQQPAATLQLCVDRRCLIFQLIHAPSIPKSLVDFLANPNHTFVGIGIDQDLEKLEEDYEFGFRTNTVDLRGLAADKYGQPELKRAGLKGLAGVVLQKDFEKPKRVTMSRWDNQWLTPAQVQYACVDAFVCFEIGRNLLASSLSASG